MLFVPAAGTQGTRPSLWLSFENTEKHEKNLFGFEDRSPVSRDLGIVIIIIIIIVCADSGAERSMALELRMSDAGRWDNLELSDDEDEGAASRAVCCMPRRQGRPPPLPRCALHSLSRSLHLAIPALRRPGASQGRISGLRAAHTHPGHKVRQTLDMEMSAQQVLQVLPTPPPLARVPSLLARRVPPRFRTLPSAAPAPPAFELPCTVRSADVHCCARCVRGRR